jgi:predicted PurR-regulated permease PerM
MEAQNNVAGDRTAQPPGGVRTATRQEQVEVYARAGLRLLAWTALGVAAWLAREILLLVFVAVVVAVALSFPVAWLQRLVPRAVAVVAVLFALGGVAAGITAVAAPTIADQVSELQASAPLALRDARAWLERFGRGESAPGKSPSPQRRTSGPGGPSSALTPEAAITAAERAVPALGAALGGIVRVVLVIVMAAFLVHDPEVQRRGLRRLLDPGVRPSFDELWTRLRDALRRWVGGIVVSMAIMGTLAAVGLLLAGIDDWLVLGALTFLGTFVPYLGAVVSAIPGLLVAAAQSSRHLLLALIVYIGVHLVEGYLVQPLIMRRAVHLNPALLLAGEGAFGALFGTMGIVVAAPALVCIQIATEYVWIEKRQRAAA